MLQDLISDPYARAIVTLVAVIIIARIFLTILKKQVEKITKKTKTKIDDIIVAKSGRAVSLLVFLFAIKIALLNLTLPQKAMVIVQDVVSSLGVLIMTYFAIVILDIIIDVWGKSFAAKTESKTDDNIIKLAHTISRTIIIVVGLMFVLQVWDIQVGPLLASLGVVGIAVAFGLQNTLGNIFGGMSVILDRSIRVGDIVKLDSETTGEVIDVGLRSTRLRTWDNEVLIIPNGKIADTKIKNYVLPNPKARIVVPFGVAYGSKIEDVKRIVLEQIEKLNTVFPDNQDILDPDVEHRVMFLEMADSSLNFKAFVYLKSYKDRFFAKEKLNCLIYDALNENNISIPFPQMDIHVDK